MIYRIAGGLFFLLNALSLLGIIHIRDVIVGVVAAIAGIALLAGL